MGKKPATIYKNIKAIPLRIQERDIAILNSINLFDGVLASRQVKSLFWPRSSAQAMERRLTALFRNNYINRPTIKQRRINPIPEPIVWLGWKGALLIASQNGFEIKSINKNNENQKRLLEKRLRKIGFRWLREPRWIQLFHDIRVIDFRLALIKSINSISDLSLEEWVNESEFRANTDILEIHLRDPFGKNRNFKKGVCPDGYFSILNYQLKLEQKPARARFLLELDNGTHPNRRFGIEKVVPGIEYIKSKPYKQRFGYNSGYWLIVTTGEKRMKNLIRQTNQYAGNKANLFFFTTFDKIFSGNLFTGPIWWRTNQDNPLPIINGK